MQEKHFPKRLHIVFALFFCCFAVIAARTLYLGMWTREHYLKTSEKMSIRCIPVPAHRGTVFDKHGRRLVWTRHRFELWCTLSAGKTFSPRQEIELKKIFPDWNFADLSDWSVPLCRDLKAGEVSGLESLIRSGYPLKIRTVRIRQKLRRKFVEKQAGDLRNGAGISGWELKYDSILRGKNGKCRVAVDSRQNWIPGSFELLEPPQHGKDVTLEIDVEKEDDREAGER